MSGCNGFHHHVVTFEPMRGFWNKIFRRRFIKVYFDGKIMVKYPENFSIAFWSKSWIKRQLIQDIIAVKTKI